MKSIELCGRSFRCQIVRKNVKNLNLRIRPDASLYVSAPLRAGDGAIESFIYKNAALICRSADKILRAAQETPTAVSFEEGERITYLGSVYTLRILSSDRRKVYPEGNELFICLEDTADTELKKKLFDSWLKEESKSRVERMCRTVFPAFCPPLKEFPVIKYRKMTSCWGNCRPAKGVLTFNSALAVLPESCMEYVVCHEFTHFLVPDHSKAFYRELQLRMADWREREGQIKKYINVLK